MKNINFIGVILIILAVVLDTSCKKKVEEPVVQAPKPVVEVKKEPQTLSKSAKDVVVELDNQGGSEYTANIHQGRLTVYRAGIFFSFEEAFSISQKYLVWFSWQAPSGGSLEVGVHPSWDKITDLKELEKRHDYILWDFRECFEPGDIFYVVGPNKIIYWGKFIGHDGNIEYFVYGRDLNEFPRVPK